MARKKKGTFNRDLIPGIFLFALFPVMAKGQLVDNPLEDYAWFYGGSQQYDFFMCWKSMLFLILVIWMLAILADRFLIRQKKIWEWKSFLPLAGYVLLVVLSTVFSVNRELSLKGMLEQYETIWILLGYTVTAFYCSQTVETKQDIQILMASLCAGAMLQGIIGIFQTCGVEFWNTVFGKKLLTLGMEESVSERLVFTFADSEANKVYMASYNPNYAGVYIILTLPLILVCINILQKKWQKLAALLTGIILCICLVASGSRMGFLTAGVLALEAAWMFAEKWKKKAAVLAGVLTLVAVSIIVYDVAGNHRLSKSLMRSMKTGKYLLTDLQPGETGVRVCFRDQMFEVSLDHTQAGDTLKVMQDGERLPVYWDMEKQQFFIDVQGYDGIAFDAYYQDGKEYVIIWRKQIPWQFVKEEGFYEYVNPYGNRDSIQKAEAVFQGHEKALSGRGYIWGRTIPLLKKTFVWGTGPDTFAVVFPQDDYLYRYHAGKSLFYQIRTKAHNMYLQTALQTGILSCICLLMFTGNVLMQLWRDRKKAPVLYGGLVLAISGYLLMGLLNDSVVAVAPLFWGILGLGLALKRMEI